MNSEIKMTIQEIVAKLVGRINPVGETNTDNDRFENLKVMCNLVDYLVTEIDRVSYENKDRHEYSMKRAGEYAHDFITNTLGIKE